MDGTLGNERAPLENGQECSYRPYYRRSSSLRSLNAIPSTTLISILVRKVKVKQGTLCYYRNDKKKYDNVSKDYENYFNATVLKKVNTEPLTHFEESLKQVGIFGAVGVSQFSYHFDANVWWAFCELWGLLTNTLHHGVGEIGISLYTLEWIGGLPILRDIYEEFLPQNKDLSPSTAKDVMDPAQAHADLQRRDTGAKFYVPPSYYEGETLDQQDARTRKIGIPLPEAPTVAIEHSNLVVTAIILVSEMSDDLVEAVPIQSIPASLASLFCNLKEDWVRESILKGVEVIIDIISGHGSARELIASRARVFQSLSALRSIIDIYNLNTIEICWLSSKIEEIFGVVKTVVKIEDLVDIDRVKALSNQDLTCSSEITHIEDQLNNLSSEALKLKVRSRRS
ncbi:hypothetical protein Cgig2_028779 [Carnegiea gigantea]|uniref:Uncharacterized protein n=1 Tax=Carnegiea gigantea TaxID=171969 RepID=A0A9Q1JSI0_9CARY|nr:hypothetical protein Cgig2_028779 [Carnegiea gigantea]